MTPTSPPPSPDQRLTVEVEDGAMPAQLFLPAAGSGPGVVLLQEVFGVTPYIQSRARDLADLGYAVLAPESYWRLGSPVLPEGMEGLPDGVAAAGQLDWDRAVGDAAGAVRFLRDRPEVTGPVALVGFCFGGGLAWCTSAALCRDGEPPDALVAYYGSQVPDNVGLAPDITCPQLQHWGNADQFIPAEGIAAVEAAVTSGPGDVTFCRYDGAGHAFDNPSPAFHDAAASREAWATTSAWLLERLPVQRASEQSPTV
jgi:carboxymethylenebutenolidase